jgi:ABC-type multidrug transport system ATPase subunit
MWRITGKTTTLAMLTGRIRPTSGDALVNSVSVIHGDATSRALLGFCPQQDPLLELLTADEHLRLYARLKVRPLAEAGLCSSRPAGSPPA